MTAVATLPELAFSVLGAERVEYAATPTLRFAVRVESTAGHPIRSLLLDTQIRIAAQRRRYDAGAQERLFELFGAPGQWGSTLRSLLNAVDVGWLSARLTYDLIVLFLC